MDLTPEAADKIGYDVYERWRAMPNRDAYVATMMATAAREAYRAGREAERKSDICDCPAFVSLLAERDRAYRACREDVAREIEVEAREAAGYIDEEGIGWEGGLLRALAIARGEPISLGRSVQGDGDNPEEQRP